MLLANYNPTEIICFSRGELQQVLMQRRFHDTRLKFVVGDVRDYDAVRFAMRDVDIVFHLAALKHVPICEEHPQEAIKTNITGTTNIVNAAIENKVDKVIDVSTDKAVEPLNLYGMTKAVGEKLVIQGNDLSTHTRFVCIRGGNVMGSNGSVIPYFIESQGSPDLVEYVSHKITLRVYYVGLFSSTQLSSDWLPRPILGGFFFNTSLLPQYTWNAPSYIVWTQDTPTGLNNYLQTNWTAGRLYYIQNKDISNTIALNE
jgi:UDP-glucose 4-epimerase